MSNFDNEIFSHSLELNCPYCVNFSFVCFICAEIFEKMLSGGLEVPFSIFWLISLFKVDFTKSSFDFTFQFYRCKSINTRTMVNITKCSQLITFQGRHCFGSTEVGFKTGFTTNRLGIHMTSSLL